MTDTCCGPWPCVQQVSPRMCALASLPKTTCPHHPHPFLCCVFFRKQVLDAVTSCPALLRSSHSFQKLAMLLPVSSRHEVEISLLSEHLPPSSLLICRRLFLPWPSVEHLSFPCFPSFLIQILALAWIKSPYSVFTTHRSASSLELTTVTVL